MRQLFAIVVASAVILGGCASVPESLQDAPAASPTPADVRAEPERYTGTRVLWGGEVAEVINGEDATRLAVVEHPLDSSARPEPASASRGRFLARFDGFLDPVVYAPGEEVTVTGRVTGIEVRTVGDYPYRYPVVEVGGHELWSERPPPAPPPGWYPGWWDCHYPWGCPAW
ncbi:Slp family lipoprotein [Arhodomonas aquaeolei]|uniref:Slp family lipoprotein n=1 Tax=Arhodomonas aquaeolei TaxID=2369 RepID=UPI00037881E7|nr:Slp family lipoprotein [Arhodomonas aquaeolei]